MTQTYSKRSLCCIKKLKELERIVPGVNAHLRITPGPWKNGKTHRYNDDVFPVLSSTPSSSIMDSPHEEQRQHLTPKKRLARTSVIDA